MLFGLVVWIVGLLMLSPIVVLGVAWFRGLRFLRRNPKVSSRQALYLVGLVLAAFCNLAYIGYWGWRIGALYQFHPPFIALLVLERSIDLCRILSALAIASLLLGEGQHRIALVLTMMWVALQVWTHAAIIHWG